MSYSLQRFLEANRAIKKVLDIKNPVGVFLGGTSGIGEHTAYAFARYTEAPSIYIVGRSEESGNRIVKKLKELNPNPNAKFEYVKCDAGLIKEDDRLCSIISGKENKVNLLVTSIAYMNFEGYKETSEGINKKLAVHYYGRWRVIQGLVPLLQEAAKKGEPARVITVHAAGEEGNIFKNDLDLKESMLG
jgi:NAD(P)-dependent dehydrogenase (short-subunit alcohol dehydrogenase family)